MTSADTHALDMAGEAPVAPVVRVDVSLDRALGALSVVAAVVTSILIFTVEQGGGRAARAPRKLFSPGKARTS